MKSLSQLSLQDVSKIKFILSDIDDTMTTHGQLPAEAYSSLWELQRHGFQIVPITGRPAGWCEMIARFWPVAGIVGENGGFYFRYHNKKMHREFYFDEKTQNENRKKLNQIEKDVLQKVPGSALASDQFCRLMDLAIDFCEDVPKLPSTEVQKIVKIFEQHGAQAKVSSIHVNGWFGDYNKKKMTFRFLEKEFGLTEKQAKESCVFLGDSPNDEPLFQEIPLSFAVANFKEFADQVNHKPQYIAQEEGGKGFQEIAQKLISLKP